MTISSGFCQFRESTLFFTDSTNVEGYGEIRGNAIFFKADLKSEESLWNYDMAKGITFAGQGFSERFEFLKIGRNPIPSVVEVISEGTVSLYRIVRLTKKFMAPLDNNGTPDLSSNMMDNIIENAYYVKRSNEKSATGITYNFKRQAAKYFADCELLVKNINNKRFTSKNVEEAVDYYNNYCGNVQDEE